MSLGLHLQSQLTAVRDADRSGLETTWLAMRGDQSFMDEATVEERGKVVLAFTKRALALGDLLLGSEILSSTDPAVRALPEVIYSQARIQIQSGNVIAARNLIRQRVDADDVTCDEISLMARTFKDAWLTGGEGSDLDRAVRWYAQAFQRFEHLAPGIATFPAINLATLSLLAGRTTESTTWAYRVLALEAKAQTDPDQAAWTTSTMGEACLVLGRIEDAEAHYRRLDPKQLGVRDRASARKQARLLLRHRGLPATTLDACFNLPRIAVFAGHMIDQPGRDTPRFPAVLEDAVRTELAAVLDRLEIDYGYCSAAAGSDILFAEELLARERGELNVFLSGPQEEFCERSVKYADDGAWIPRFERVIKNSANRVDRSPDHHPSDRSLGYVFANFKLCGMAAIRARSLGLDLVPLAVHDGHHGDAEGGTADFASIWEARTKLCDGWDDSGKIFIQPTIIDLERILESELGIRVTESKTRSRTSNPSARSRFRVQGMQQDIKAMLFADVKGFSSLSEDTLQPFFNEYMRTISQLIDRVEYRPVVSETWGDAVYMVFNEVEQAGQFALEMRRRLTPKPVGDLDCAHLGLPDHLAIRIALHAGPVFSLVDPVMRRISFTGRHVSQAARLEPITQAGEVYATESFAALAWFENATAFSCEFLGLKHLAKDYGDVRVFKLCQTRETVEEASRQREEIR